MRRPASTRPARLRLLHRAALVGAATAALLGAGACKDRAPQGSCPERVAATRAALAPVAAAEALITKLGPVAFMEAPAGAPFTTPRADAVVSVDTYKLYVDGAALGADLRDGEGVRRALRERLAAASPATVGLAFDRDAPWGTIVAVVDEALRGRDHVELLVVGPEPDLSSSPLAARLAAAPPDAMLALLARTTEEAIGSCQPARRLFADLDEARPGAPFDVLALADAVQQCECDCDVEALTEVMRFLHAPATPLVAVELRPSDAARAVPGADAEPWSGRAEALLRASPDARPIIPPELALEPDPEPLPEPEP
ncbi:MAG: hypothetical protein R3A79_11020 [Nannocystaceae bacterium]